MIQITDIESFRAGLSGTALIQGNDGYDQARSAWNGAIDRYPAVIARCQSAADVATAIRYARQRDLEIPVRGGFHNAAGRAICDDGLMIDLSPMREVSVNPATRRARVGGGATVTDLDAATQAHGLATPAGIVTPYRRGRSHAGWRDRLADRAARPHGGQPCLRRGCPR